MTNFDLFFCFSLLGYQWLEKCRPEVTQFYLKGVGRRSRIIFMDLYGIVVQCNETKNIYAIDQTRLTVLRLNLGRSGRVIGALKGILVVSSSSSSTSVNAYCRKTLKLVRKITGQYKVVTELREDMEYNIYIKRRTSDLTTMVTKLQDDASEKFVWAGVNRCPSKLHRCSVQANQYSIQLVCLSPFCKVVTTIDLQTNGEIRRETLSPITTSSNEIMNSCGGLIIKLKYGLDHIICHKTGQTMHIGGVSMLYKEYMISQSSDGGLKCYSRQGQENDGYNMQKVWQVPPPSSSFGYMMMDSRGLIPNAFVYVKNPDTMINLVPLSEEYMGQRVLTFPVGRYVTGPDGRSLARLSFHVEKNMCLLEYSELIRDKKTIKEFLFG